MYTVSSLTKVQVDCRHTVKSYPVEYLVYCRYAVNPPEDYIGTSRRPHIVSLQSTHGSPDSPTSVSRIITL